MNDFDFADDSGSIGRHEKSAQVVDDEFVSTWASSDFPVEEGSGKSRTIWPETCPDKVR